MKERKRIHPLFEGTKKLTLHIKFPKFQWIFSTRYASMSMISPSDINFGKWEIYSIKGNLIPDIERFDTEKQVRQRIEELMKRGD